MVEPIEEAAHPTGFLSAMPARNCWNATQTSFVPSVVVELHVERIEAAAGWGRKFLAVLREAALVARAFELAVGRVELDRAAQVRASRR